MFEMMKYQEVSDAYETMKNDPNNPIVRNSYDAFIKVIETQFQTIPVKVEFTEIDPYANTQEMVNDIKNGRLKIFTGFSNHPIQTPEQNWKFRAVHDYYAHYLSNNPLTDKGEYYAWLDHRAMLPKEAWMALAVETRGQSAYETIHGHFPPQKVGLFPKHLI